MDWKLFIIFYIKIYISISWIAIVQHTWAKRLKELDNALLNRLQ
jgi:hypothetical protein